MALFLPFTALYGTDISDPVIIVVILVVVVVVFLSLNRDALCSLIVDTRASWPDVENTCQSFKFLKCSRIIRLRLYKRSMPSRSNLHF